MPVPIAAGTRPRPPAAGQVITARGSLVDDALFVVPNAPDAAFADQAQLDNVDLQVLAASAQGTGVVWGCGVVTTGAADGSVIVGAGQVRLVDTLVTVARTTVPIVANASGLLRYDLVVIPVSGIPVVVAGTPAATPEFPPIPPYYVAVAVVRVANGHGPTTVLAPGAVVSKSVRVSNRFVTTGAPGQAGTEWLFQQTDPAKVMVRLRGAQWAGGPFANTFLEVDDYLDAPIAWVSGVGGVGVNDDLYTAYSVLGDYPFKADIYGFQWRKSQCSYAFDGPPGNMLDWQSACHEVYQATRAPAFGMWGVVAACTLATFDFALPPTASPTKYRRGLRLTNTTGGSMWIATFGGAAALGGVVPGQVYSLVANVRSNSAAAARNANLRVAWFDSGGTQIGTDIVGSTVSVPNTGVFTTVGMAGQIAPALAAKVQMQIVVASAINESHDVVGCGIMKGTSEAKFGPPFVAQHLDSEPPVANGSIAGDHWYRTDTTLVPGKREYVQTVGTKAAPAHPENQIWVPLDSSDVKRLLTDVSFTSTTLAPVTPYFDVSVAANEQYEIEYLLAITSAATTTGWQFSITGPASPVSVLGVCEYQSSATAWTTATIQAFAAFTATAAAYVATPSQILVRITVVLVNGVNAGTVALNVKTAVAASAIVVKQGSTTTVS